MKANTHNVVKRLVEYIPKLEEEWSAKDRKLAALEYLARDILFYTLDEEKMNDTQHCQTTKEVWDYLGDICKEFELIMRNKLQLCLEKYQSFAMIFGETVQKMENRFHAIVGEMTCLERTNPCVELNLKIHSCMPHKWEMKVNDFQERDLSSMPTREVFSFRRGYEFSLNRKKAVGLIPTTVGLIPTTVAPTPVMEDVTFFVKKDFTRQKKYKQLASTTSSYSERIADPTIAEL